jgi:hypothetical protein
MAVRRLYGNDGLTRMKALAYLFNLQTHHTHSPDC